MYNMAAVFFYKHIGYNLHILIGDNVVVFTEKNTTRNLVWFLHEVKLSQKIYVNVKQTFKLSPFEGNLHNSYGYCVISYQSHTLIAYRLIMKTKIVA